jgi:hypothetical protein
MQALPRKLPGTRVKVCAVNVRPTHQQGWSSLPQPLAWPQMGQR